VRAELQQAARSRLKTEFTVMCEGRGVHIYNSVFRMMNRVCAWRRRGQRDLYSLVEVE
jgi:hypothetical protein